MSDITTENSVFIILPIEDYWWICQINEKEIQHLAKAPGGNDARYFTSPSNPELFAYVDQARKRIALYRYLNVEPWFEKVISPSTLPRNCRADDVLIHDGLLYVGGNGKMGECLWTRDKEDKNWRLIPMPCDISLKGDLFSRYKSIDLLFLDGTRLIAVDDIVIPKWILTYDVTHNKTITHLETIKLSDHITYESVKAGAMNKSYIALLSQGVNHGVVSQHLSILDICTLTEIASWCVYSSEEYFNDTQQPPKKSRNVINSVAFLADNLLLATQEGVLCVSLPNRDDLKEELELCQFEKIRLHDIVNALLFVRHHSLCNTFFVVGYNSDEQIHYEYVDMNSHPRSKVKSPLLQEQLSVSSLLDDIDIRLYSDSAMSGCENRYYDDFLDEDSYGLDFLDED